MANLGDFDAFEAEQKREPITFTLGGRSWTVAHLGAHSYLSLIRKGAEGGVEAELALGNYVTSILEEEEREPFERMLEERDIQMSTLMELLKRLVAASTGNPTTAVSSSPAQPSKRGQRPKVVSLDGGSRSKASRSAAS